MKLNTGEKIFLGTIATVSLAGGPTGYAVGGNLNDTSPETVRKKEQVVELTQQELDTTVSSFPDCEQTVIGTIESIPERPYNLDLGSIAVSQCGPSAAANIEQYDSAREALRIANYRLEEAKNDSNYTKGEKLFSITFGLTLGWAASWMVAGVGAGLTGKFSNYRDRRSFNKTSPLKSQ